MEAYKKYALVSIMENGKVRAASRTRLRAPKAHLLRLIIVTQRSVCLWSTQILTLPQYTPSVVSRMVDKFAEAYLDLEKAYISGEVSKTTAAYTKWASRFAEVRRHGAASKAVIRGTKLARRVPPTRAGWLGRQRRPRAPGGRRGLLPHCAQAEPNVHHHGAPRRGRGAGRRDGRRGGSPAAAHGACDNEGGVAAVAGADVRCVV